MKGNNRGFTLIEVSLFLAITGLLFLGVTIGVQNSIFQQRYNDSVQSFVEFLQSAYSKTENVQGVVGGGRTGQAIYGKLITFGEKTNLKGEINSDDEIFVYDLIGSAACNGAVGGTLDALKLCNVDVQDSGVLRGQAESYTPKWLARIQAPKKSGPFVGAILITRHPQSGTIYTFVNDSETIEVNQGKTISDKLNTFKMKDVDFCLNPDGYGDSNIQKDIRLRQGARNIAGIEVMPDYDNVCVK